jgi:hypothetical protein
MPVRNSTNSARAVDMGDEEFPKARLRALAGGGGEGGNVGGDGRSWFMMTTCETTASPTAGTAGLIQ